LQSFLLGQREFRSTLLAEGLEQLRQRVIAAYHLSPLSHDETRDYIEHRLRLVGWNGAPSFSDAALDSIYRFTGGTPRRINLLCDRVLLYGFLEERWDIDEAAVKAVHEELYGEFSYPNIHYQTLFPGDGIEGNKFLIVWI
jgi:type II secretory pathway predicted ATPase ExeA